MPVRTLWSTLARTLQDGAKQTMDDDETIQIMMLTMCLPSQQPFHARARAITAS